MKQILFLLLQTLLVLSCEQSADWELYASSQPRLVIEAILTDEPVTQEILLSTTYPDINGQAPGVSEALVQVETNGIVYTFSPDAQQPGLFRSDIPFEALPALEYYLRVEWGEQVFTASSRLSEVLPIPNPVFVPVANTDSMFLANFIPVFSTNEQAFYRVDILPGGGLAPLRLYYYTFSSIDMSQLAPPGRETVYFPRGSQVEIVKYGLNEDFAAYLRAKVIETDWNGSFFYGAPDNLPTNITPEGLGFFSTCEVVRGNFVAE